MAEGVSMTEHEGAVQEYSHDVHDPHWALLDSDMAQGLHTGTRPASPHKLLPQIMLWMFELD